MDDIKDIEIVEYKPEDVPAMLEIWNEVIRSGSAFPEIEPYSLSEAEEFFRAQSYCGVAKNMKSGKIYGVYDQHPNLSGRSGHIANGSYAVSSDSRGKHIGEMLVRDSIEKAKLAGYRILQFNAVVKSNISAWKLYEKIGFVRVGVIEGGFKNSENEFEDMYIYAYYMY